MVTLAPRLESGFLAQIDQKSSPGLFEQLPRAGAQRYHTQNNEHGLL
jgi:hypothetical protein